MKKVFLALLLAVGEPVFACDSHTSSAADKSHEIMNVKCPVKFCYGTLSDSYEYDYRGRVYKCSNGHKLVIGR